MCSCHRLPRWAHIFGFGEGPFQAPPARLALPSELGFVASTLTVGLLSHLDLYLNARGKLELHQCVDRLGRRRVDVEDALVGAELELLTSLLVYEGRAVNRKNLLARGQGYRSANYSTSALHGLYDLLGRLVDEVVIERLEVDSNFLIHIAFLILIP